MIPASLTRLVRMYAGLALITFMGKDMLTFTGAFNESYDQNPGRKQHGAHRF